MEFKIQKKFPTNEEFNELFDSVGWGNRDDEKINKVSRVVFIKFEIFFCNRIVCKFCFFFVVHNIPL